MLRAVVLLALGLWACGESGANGNDPGHGGASGDAGSVAAMGGRGTDGGAGAGGGGGTGGGGGEPCGGRAAPTMINVGEFCIDSTEVTRDQYAEFRNAIGNTTPAQPASCSWNTSFDADASSDPAVGDLPVSGVDWCDAFAYCAWAGKRLCGSPAGGAAPYDAPADAAQSSWFSACAAAGSKVFPYGAAYDPQACNGGDYDGPDVGPLPVGSVTTCEGGYPGIFDMSGNVWEWEDACQTSAGAADLCRARGGGFGNGDDFHRCDYVGFSPARNFQGPVGIRCCSRIR